MDKTGKFEISWDADRGLRSIFWFLVGLEVALVVLDSVFNFRAVGVPRSIQRLFNIAREDSLAAWFASVHTLAVGVVLWITFLVYRKNSEDVKLRRFFFVLACFFTYLAVDDGAGIHERVGTVVKVMFSGPETALDESEAASHVLFFPSYTWQLIFVPVFAAVALWMLVVLLRKLHPARSKQVFVLALACYAVAVGLDFVEGLRNAHNNLAGVMDLKASTVRHYSKVIEEFLEMFGTTLFLVTFAGHLAMLVQEVNITIKRDFDAHP